MSEPEKNGSRAERRQSLKLERRDTGLSETPSSVSTKSKRKKSLKYDESPLSSRPRSPDSMVSADVLDTRRKKKYNAAPPGTHKVTFTITVAKAVLSVGNQPEKSQRQGRVWQPSKFDSDDTHCQIGGEGAKRKKRIVEAPRAQNFYHCEYFLLPDDDEAVKTDVVIFGMAAKIYTEKQEPKVLKTWQDNDQTWVAWTHCHTLAVSEDILMKLFNHTLELRIWDTRDKMSTRAKFDRPKAFRLPQPKPGEDADNIGGVKSLVMKQSRSFENLQPKKSYIKRPLPSQKRPTLEHEVSQDSVEVDRVRTEKMLKNKKAGGPVKDAPEKIGEDMRETLHGKESRTSTTLAAVTTEQAISPPTQDGQPLKSYGHLLGLAGKDPVEEVDDDLPSRGREVASRGRQPPVNLSKHRGIESTHQSLHKTDPGMPPGDTDSSVGRRTPTNAKARRHYNRKAEAAAAAAAEQIRKYGVASVSVQMGTLFAGMQTVTNRLEKSVSTLDDVFLTVSLSGPLMSEEQRRKLNPLVIKVHSATQMPDTPLNYADLRLRCMPAFVKYRFFNQVDHTSFGREQDSAIYWDDINVILAGTMEPSELHEYLNGPPLEIEVHDRDRVAEKTKLKPTLFGDDLEDQKISNVGTVASKRTMHNPFSGRNKPWDPYGVAKFDLSGLLLGQQVLHLKSPVHQCPSPDILGVRDAQKQGGKLVGVAGVLDGPVDLPLPPGHYLETSTMLKIRLELAYPLTIPDTVATKESTQVTSQCPFNRLVFRFAYKNILLLHQLQGLVTELNARALQLDDMPQHVIDAALSTYKLSAEQQQSHTLDIVTGFQVLDGNMHLFVLEGLRDGAVPRLWDALPKAENADVDVLYNSALSFRERLYGPLDVDLCRIKLHEPLDVIMQQPLLYVRDMVPLPCFSALSKLHQLQNTTKLADAVRNDLFPRADMIVSMSREFGVPLTTDDFEELQPEKERVVASPVQYVDIPKTSRVWTPIDNMNRGYLEQLGERQAVAATHNYIQENKEIVRMRSDENGIERSKTMPATIQADVAVSHNYSTQKLNSTEQAKEKLRNILSEEPDQRYTYCPEYHHSMAVVPVNVQALAKEKKEVAVERWKTPAGWIFPGKKSMRESNVHPKKPHQARVDEVHQDWVENTLHTNVLEPTLERDRLTWSKRKVDIDVWTRPLAIFGKNEPATIHLAGSRLKEEKMAALIADHEEWKSKVVVDDTSMTFHRCAPETEKREHGFKSSNQLDRLQSILKDIPQKLSLRSPSMALGEIPPLSVVLNPSVDTLARVAGLPLLPAVENEQEEKTRGFVPGPFEDSSWLLEKNKIPIQDYHHEKFRQLKGHDFNVYHKARSSLHKRTVKPLSDREYENHLFRWPDGMTRSRSLVIPDNFTMKRLIPDIIPQGNNDHNILEAN